MRELLRTLKNRPWKKEGAVGRRACFDSGWTALPALNQLHGKHSPYQGMKCPGRFRGVGATENPDQVPDDLYGCDEESPRKAPPPTEGRVEGTAELALDATGAATDLRLAAPGLDQDRRPNLVPDVNIDGARPAAERAVSRMDLDDLLENGDLGDLICQG